VRRITAAKRAFYTVALLPLVVMTGCAEGGGVRVEGNAPASVVPPTVHGTSPTPKVDPVTLLQHDPKVDDDIKDHLRPCGGDEYPIDTSYGNLTGAATPDLVINVSTCSDGVGLGSYVYRMEQGRYVDVFGDDQPPVYIDIEQGELELTRQVYAHDDAVCCPSGEDVIMYRWTGTGFTETSHTHNEYGTKAG
jgi:hypothetical protein